MTRGVVKKWEAKLAYVDVFAGPGRSIIRDSEEEVEGSPVLSLKYEFAKYVFVDKPEVLSSLKKRLNGHPKSAQIIYVEGDCNDVIDDVRSALPADHLTLAFIDPTGLQIKFRTVQRLVQNRKVDLLMTLQFGMGIKRNLQQYIRAERAALTSYLGTPDGGKMRAPEDQRRKSSDESRIATCSNCERWDTKHFVTGKSKSGTTRMFFCTSWRLPAGIPWEVSFGAKLSRLNGPAKGR